MRLADEPGATPVPTLADMEAARIGLQRRLRNPGLRLIGVAGATLQRLPLLPAVARATVSVLRRDARTQ